MNDKRHQESEFSSKAPSNLKHLNGSKSSNENLLSLQNVQRLRLVIQFE